VKLDEQSADLLNRTDFTGLARFSQFAEPIPTLNLLLNTDRRWHNVERKATTPIGVNDRENEGDRS
jgi:hypothetical protein